MSISIAEKLSIRIANNGNYSSGILYPNGTHTYAITAKHSVCEKEVKKCWLQKRLKCENCTEMSTCLKNIELDRPDLENYGKLHIDDVIFFEDKDVAILVLKDECHRGLLNLPKVKIELDKEISSNTILYSCGYPSILDNAEQQPIIYKDFGMYKNKFYINIDGDTTSDLMNPSAENMSGNSGAGILKNNDKIGILVGVYTETGGFGSGFGEFIDPNINDILVSKGYPKLDFINNADGFNPLIKNKFKECFSRVEHSIDFPENRELNLYRLALDGKKYNYSLIQSRLIDCIPNFTLSRKELKKIEDSEDRNLCIYQSYKNFIDISSDDKLPEILLQGFLETYCNAPKLYSSHQNENSVFQGAHIRFSDNNVEIIHSIALFSKDLCHSFNEAIEKVILKFPDLKPFGGLIDNSFLDNTYTEKECEILAKLIIPNKNGKSCYYIDRIAIFIGYDKELECSWGLLQQDKFLIELEKYIVRDIEKSIEKFKDNFDKISMLDAAIDCFFVPFEDTDKFKFDFLASL